MKIYECSNCGSRDVFIESKGSGVGLYCGDCGKWLKWLSKEEERLVLRYLKTRSQEDLISRTALLEEINNSARKPEIHSGSQEAEWLRECINSAPVAFNMERVCQQLKHHNTCIYQGDCVVVGRPLLTGEEAIKIVKAGGF